MVNLPSVQKENKKEKNMFLLGDWTRMHEERQFFYDLKLAPDKS